MMMMMIISTTIIIIMNSSGVSPQSRVPLDLEFALGVSICILVSPDHVFSSNDTAVLIVEDGLLPFLSHVSSIIESVGDKEHLLSYSDVYLYLFRSSNFPYLLQLLPPCYVPWKTSVDISVGVKLCNCIEGFLIIRDSGVGISCVISIR